MTSGIVEVRAESVAGTHVPGTRSRRWSRQRLLAVAVGLLALVASANSITNGFAYDDVALIQNAPRIHSMDGWAGEFARTYWPGADGYRPLTIIGWRLQWSIGNGSPMLFHAVNIVLHVATAVLVFWLALAMLPLAAAWLAAAFYAVHPVHVEAIANVVGQSELVVALCVVAAMGLYLQGRSRGAPSSRRWAAIAALYVTALMFKEHAIVLPALILLAEVTVVRDAAALRGRLAAIRVPLLCLALAAVAYLWVRSGVTADFSGFRPFIVFDALNLSATDRILTMVGVAPDWLRLLLWPAKLVIQYAPPHTEVAQGPSVSQLPGLLVLVGIVSLALATWRRSPVTSFGIGWVIVTLLPASNFILPAGFIIAERTLLLPSVGAMLAVGSGIAWLTGRPMLERRSWRIAAASAAALLIVLGAARSIARNPVWRDNDSLYAQGVIDAPDSYFAHFHLASHHFGKMRIAEGRAHYNRSIELFPYDPLVAYSYAEQLRAAGLCEPAMPLYQFVFEAWPESRRGHLGYSVCLLRQRRFEEAEREVLTWLSRGGRITFARDVLNAVRTGRDSIAAQREVDR